MIRRDFIKRSVLLVAAGSVGGYAIDQSTATKRGLPHVKFNYPETRRPGPSDALFSKVPIAHTYDERRRMYLTWASAHPTPNSSGGVLTDLLKLEAGTIKTLSAESLKAALQFVNDRKDPSDFTLSYLIRLYYLHHNDGTLTPQQAEDIRVTLLGYRYGLEEPGHSEAEMWTENHQILIHGSNYLVGQIFPDATFTNDGRTGREHRDKARATVLRWLHYHARTGPAEWDSVPYYNMDLAALLNLVEFAYDSEVQISATMMVDLYLFDMAVNSYCGQMGTSHGRAYAQNVLSAAGDSLLNFQTLAFGCGRLQSIDMASTMLVTGQSYKVPPVLEAIGLDMPEEMVNIERHSIPLTPEAAATYGLSLTNIDDFELWWGMGAFSNPPIINLTYDAISKYDLWNYAAFRPLKAMGIVLRPLGLLPSPSQMLNPASNGTLMSEVNKLTYRTPDGMLSTALDYRPGEEGYQQHIWQATLGPYAVVFVTNPGSNDRFGGPGYWMANGRMPRNAQFRNVLISMYNIPRHEFPRELEPKPYGFTHAYFPKWAFDEVVEVPSDAGGGWTFGRFADGYIGLYSHLRCTWTTSGPEAGQELIAPGLKNIWICELGRKATDGTFKSFIHNVSQAAIDVTELQVRYRSPHIGNMRFGWEGPLTVEGKAVALHDYPRWDNPYAHVEFGSETFHIEHKGQSLDLDFQMGVRRISA